MARIRTVKPEFFMSETVASCSFRARLLFIGLWTQADDEGRLIDNTRVLKGQLFALDDDVTSKAIDRDLEELADRRLIVRYQVDGKRFIVVRSFLEHQSINRATQSKLPSPPVSADPIPPGESHITDDSLSTHGGLSEDSLQERKGKEIDARAEPVLALVPSPPPEPSVASAAPSDFDQFWDVYPRKIAKQQAQKAWKRLKVNERAMVLDRVDAFARRAKGTDPQYIVYPGKWLSERRWEDVKPTRPEAQTGTEHLAW